MNAIALQSTPDSPPAKKQQAANHLHAPSWSKQLIASVAGLVIQRKATCACGGDCPRCEQDSPQQRIQTKLAISTPGDQYEQEADRVADQVMRMPDADIENAPIPHAQHTSTLIQRKCVSCAGPSFPAQPSFNESNSLTSEMSATPFVSMDQLLPYPSIQVQSARGPPIQKQTEQTRHNEDRDDQVSGGLSPTLGQDIQQLSGGQPLPISVRAFMEPRFGADFGEVRLHTGPQAERLTSQLQAQAFTYGRNIWLAAGESPSDLPLLAHELTHILQQNPSLSRRVQPSARVEQTKKSPQPMVQRSIDFWGPRPLRSAAGPGTRTHATVQDSLGRVNADLFFEVNIPGGNRTAIAQGLWGERVLGRTDFYKSNSSTANPNGTTIGVEFTDGDPEPRFLSSDRGVKLANRRFSHIDKAAPAGKSGVTARSFARVCPTVPTPGVCRLDTAPTSIKVGDLKPPNLGERRLGTQQLSNYIAGIHGTASRVNAFAQANPASASPANTTWNPTAQTMAEEDFQIPPQHQKATYPNTTGRRHPVVRYKNGVVDDFFDVKQAFLYVIYDTSNPGIWYYEYVLPPSELSGAGAAGGLQQQQQAVLTPLQNTVIAPLNTTPRGGTKRRPGASAPAPAQINVKPASPSVQRQVTDNFRIAEWRPRYQQWRTQARPFLRSRTSDQIDEISIATQVRARTGIPIPVPAQAASLRTEQRRIEHWAEHGAIYGRLRQAFGTTYVKIVEFYQRARTRFGEALSRRNQPVGGAQGSGLLGVVIRVAFDILKLFAGFLLRETGERLVRAVRSGAESVLRQFFGPEIDFVEEQIQRVNSFVTGIEEAARQEFLAVVEEIVGPFERHIARIEEVQRVLGNIVRFVNYVKWGVRIASCVSPPALGCLWGFLGTEVAEQVGATVARSCWFKRQIMLPIISAIGFVREMPDHIARFILDRVRSLLPAQPPQIRQLLGEPDTSPANLQASQVDCGGADTREVRPEHEALIRLYERYGEDTMDELLRALYHAGAGRRGGHLTLEVINRLELFLSNTRISAADLRRYVAETPARSAGSSNLDAELEAIREWRHPTRQRRPDVTIRQPRDQAPAPPPTGITIINF